MFKATLYNWTNGGSSRGIYIPRIEVLFSSNYTDNANTERPVCDLQRVRRKLRQKLQSYSSRDTNI